MIYYIINYRILLYIMDKQQLYEKSFKFYINLKNKYNNLKIAYNYNTIRIYTNDLKSKTKTLYYILNKTGDIVTNLKNKKIIGNINSY